MRVDDDFDGSRFMKKILFIIAALFVAGAGCLVTQRQSRALSARPSSVSASPSPHATPSPRSTPRAPLKLPLAAPKVVINKTQRRLTLYDDGRVVREYRVALGRSPVEDKARQGDMRTPEGEFYVFTKNEKSAFYLSLGLSYPNIEDAERGLRDGLINDAQYRRIVRAIRRKAAPPMNTPLGGDIYIHGGGVTGIDWTFGCTALEDTDIKELFDAVPVGTTVVIEH